MSGRTYIKVPIRILYERRWATLSADEWWTKFIETFDVPENTYCESAPERLGWLRVRVQRTKEVYARDEHHCRYCGSTDRLEIDHIYPLARGGSNDLDNLQILCKKCNRKKWAYLPEEVT